MQAVSINGYEMFIPKEYVDEIFGTNEHNFEDRYKFVLSYDAPEKFYYDVINYAIYNIDVKDKDLDWIIRFVHIHTNVNNARKFVLCKRYIKLANNIDDEMKHIIELIISKDAVNLQEQTSFTYIDMDGNSSTYTIVLGRPNNKIITYSDFTLCTDEFIIKQILQKNTSNSYSHIMYVLAMLEFVYMFRKSQLHLRAVLFRCISEIDFIKLYPEDHPAIKAAKKFMNRSDETTVHEVTEFYKTLE